MIILVTGGARSGKSHFAQSKALELSKNPVYVATAKVWDDDFQQRVERHKADRGAAWTSYEAQKDLWKLPLQRQVVVIDCITLWLTNYFVELKNDVDQSLEAFKNEVQLLQKIDATLIMVTNEIGLGIHPHNEVGRKFVDLQGWANQHVAALADQVVLMVSGIPMFVKS